MTVTLVLDASGRLPMGHATVEEAVSAVVTGRAFALADWEGRVFRSQRLAVPAPKVLCTDAAAVMPAFRYGPGCNRILFARDGFRCQYCGGYHRRYRHDVDPDLWLPPGVRLTRDHVVPRVRFPETRDGRLALDAWENLATACERCNHAKGDTPPWAWDVPLLVEPAAPRRHLLTFPHLLDAEQMSFVAHLLPN